MYNFAVDFEILCNKAMRKRIYILLATIVFGMTTTALAQSFSTSSDMMNTGSTLSSNVYGVGAGSVDPMVSTASSSPVRRSSGEQKYDDFGNLIEDGNQDQGSPIGAPYIMLLFAAGAAGVVALRRRRLL